MDILEALDSLRHNLQNCTEAEFLSSDLIFGASAYKLAIVGEAATRVSPETKERNPHIEWRAIAGLRNVLVHEYFGVDRSMVWEVASVEAPRLRDQLAAILLAEFPE